MSGKVSHCAGAAAEDGVWEDYCRRGHALAARRWRPGGGRRSHAGAGEIDLIARKDGVVVFIEVKRARDIATAAARLGQRQMARIARSAEAFLGGEPAGTDTPARFDVALVDGTGRIEIVENAFAA